MSLYFDASRFLGQSTSSVKSRVFSDKTLKSNPSQVFALVTEARKWAAVLKEVIDNASLLSLERKLTPELALLLVHDLLLAKKGIAAPSGHKLRTAIEKHRTRLQAELTKSRLRRRCPTIKDLKKLIDTSTDPSQVSDSSLQSENPGQQKWRHPRWVRINRLKTDMDEQVRTTFAEYQSVNALVDMVQASASARLLHRDEHIPDLLAVSPDTDLTKSQAYVDGKIILQDKASCFPAYLLDPQPQDGYVIDGCAAPGNKTTHLASLRHISGAPTKEQHIYACERDKQRAQTLQRMIQVAGAQPSVAVKAGQDFLKIDPAKEPWSKVGAILLDPSCSGSGIVGRDDENSEAVDLPSLPLTMASSVSKKRKRSQEKEPVVAEPAAPVEEMPEESVTKERLQALSAFQTKLVKHALRFPAARKVTYSTCSVHDEENEHVIATVLASEAGSNGGWRILPREEQVEGMKKWHLRGRISSTDAVVVDFGVAEACIRCEKHTKDGTQGFFVAALIRDVEPSPSSPLSLEDDEWSGFGD